MEGSEHFGPVWVKDLQTQVAALGVFLGIALRVVKFKLDIQRPERLLLYCFLLALGATILTTWEMQIAFALSNIKGVLVASANVTLSMLGTGKALDLGADSIGIDIKKHDANNREHSKLSL